MVPQGRVRIPETCRADGQARACWRARRGRQPRSVAGTWVSLGDVDARQRRGDTDGSATLCGGGRNAHFWAGPGYLLGPAPQTFPDADFLAKTTPQELPHAQSGP